MASALPETLRSITATKIQELSRQRNNFESTKASIYAKAAGQEDLLDQTRSLLDSICHLKNVRIFNDDSDVEQQQSQGLTAYQLRNKNLLLRQAAVDPSVEKSTVSDVKKSLEHDLELESSRHRHAEFFSKLVTEWLSNPDDDGQATDSTTFEAVGRKEMHEQRAMWESLAFSDKFVNTQRIEDYLDELFNNGKSATLATETLVRDTRIFGANLIEEKDIFDISSLERAMTGLLQTDLLSEEKNSTLRTFKANKEVLKEVADVLNMRYASLASWKWTTGSRGVSVEMKRQLNGKYRVFMDEDVLDAIFLYEIGLRWSVHLKSVFTAFFDSLAWKRSDKPIPKRDRERREFFLKNDRPSLVETVQAMRRANYSERYFLTQLPTTVQSGKRNYDEDNEADNTKLTGKSALELKHGLLHMLVAEALIAKEINPDTVHTVIRSDFKWFGPSMSHDTIFTVLKFFGVNDTWIEFFRKFLQPSLSFVHDGPGAQVRTRIRGVPLSHSLSDFLGEAVMFVMDTAVNQVTSSYLYRLHDDFWLWGSEELCLRGWQVMTEFADVMGIEFNQEKTGTVRFGTEDDGESSDSDISDAADDLAFRPETKSLPKGEVRWGFLRLDAGSGRFVVDQDQVDEHIKELQLQLACRKSIFSYIQSYNAYVGRFFTNNFGKPSYGFGRDHVTMMIQTFERIQKTIFPSGNVTDHLASLARERFNMEDLPQGFWYFPVELGGLELHNPLIALIGMRESLRESPQRMLRQARDRDESDYHAAEVHFKEHGSTTGFGRLKDSVIRDILDSGEEFLTKEEYLRYREERSMSLGLTYRKLLRVPREMQMQASAELTSLLKQGESRIPLDSGKINSNFATMQPYWKWMVEKYGTTIAQRYGSLSMVDDGQVPIGVVNLMKKGRVRWRG